MKINFMMFLIGFLFVLVLGSFGYERYHNIKMAEQGLEQCVVAINANTYEAIWSKECPK